MTQQVINVGSAPNDGTGDPARTAFQKTNSNFTELYTATNSATPFSSLSDPGAYPSGTGNRIADSVLLIRNSNSPYRMSVNELVGADIQVFNPATTVSNPYTWTLPPGGKNVRAYLVGAGGGGSFVEFTADATQLNGTTLQIYIGAGGTGGAARTGSVGAGNAGNAGGATYILSTTSTASLLIARAYGGLGGQGGSNTGANTLGGNGAGTFTTVQTGGATTATSGTGTTATITFAPALAVAPTVGSTVQVEGVAPYGYNGTYTITASTTTSVSFANTTTGAQTLAGYVVFTYATSGGATGMGDSTSTLSYPAQVYGGGGGGGTSSANGPLFYAAGAAFGGGGGGGGGSIKAGAAGYGGGGGSTFIDPVGLGFGGAVGQPGVVGGGAILAYTGGGSGSGGGGSNATAGGHGGAGGTSYGIGFAAGGGGGGGGASTFATTEYSGAGGQGNNGLVVIITTF